MKFGCKDLYKYIFGSPQFPFWFVIQATYSSYIAINGILLQRKNLFLVIQQMILAFLMTFIPREIVAYMTEQLSPMQNNPELIRTFFAIYVILNIPIIFSLVQILFDFLGMAQGANEARLLKFLLHSFQHLPPRLSLPYALILTVLDQFIEICWRFVFGTLGTTLSCLPTMIKKVIFTCIYYSATNYTFLTKYIGHYAVYWPSLILAIILGIIICENHIAILYIYSRFRRIK